LSQSNEDFSCQTNEGNLVWGSLTLAKVKLHPVEGGKFMGRGQKNNITANIKSLLDRGFGEVIAIYLRSEEISQGSCRILSF